MSKHLLTPDELAERWSVSTQGLANWRSQGIGPAFVKIGRRVRYAISEVVAYERAHSIGTDDAVPAHLE